MNVNSTNHLIKTLALTFIALLFTLLSVPQNAMAWSNSSPNTRFQSTSPNPFIQNASLIDVCKSSHHEGYSRLYRLLQSKTKQGLDISYGWWPALDLQVQEQDFVQLNENIVQFKHPIEAVITQVFAPSKMRETEFKFKKRYPALSHFVFNQAVRATLNVPSEIKRLDQALRTNLKDDDNGPINARKHAIWSALLTRYLGAQVTLCVLGFHEVDNTWNPEYGIFQHRTNPILENATLMDFYNNAMGITLALNFKGSDKEMMKAVENLLFDGHLAVLNETEVVSSKVWIKKALFKLQKLSKL